MLELLKNGRYVKNVDTTIEALDEVCDITNSGCWHIDSARENIIEAQKHDPDNVGYFEEIVETLERNGHDTVFMGDGSTYSTFNYDDNLSVDELNRILKEGHSEYSVYDTSINEEDLTYEGF